MTSPAPESPSAPGRRHRLVRSIRAATTTPPPSIAPVPVAGEVPVRTPAPRPEPPAHPDAVATTDLVDRLRTQWSRSGADIATRLRAGVETGRLDAVEHELGLTIPVGARTWWSLVDGVDPFRTRYRTSAPTVGPGGWVPLGLDDAVRRATGQGPGPGAPPGLLPVFARDEELIAVRLGTPDAHVEQLVLVEGGEGYQHGWRVPFEKLLATWAGSLVAAVHWLPDAHDWVVDPFAVQALPDAHLLD